MRKVSESVNPDIYSPSSSQNGDSFPRTFPPSVTGHHRQFDGLTAGRNYEYQSSPPSLLWPCLGCVRFAGGTACVVAWGSVILK
ncbi:hypothetical protein JTE90_013905 [Oedothorax gibbosus]|uniref:Uncharacterized protein n=1 Tax=Oedothorax gibbosus TaxID=931172 RepID=A0AAV6UDM0_9ARAC|nr:hypothetical protein JTE90_013905 [Oedothorax gibbosus]